MNGIIGFEIEITVFQAPSKLSQNRDDENYKRILNGPEQKGDMNSLEIAVFMKNSNT